MLVEPVHKLWDVGRDIKPAVRSPGLDDQLARNFRFLQLLDDELRLLERYNRIGVAVHDKRRWLVGADVVDRGKTASDFQSLLLIDSRHVSGPFLVVCLK